MRENRNGDGEVKRWLEKANRNGGGVPVLRSVGVTFFVFPEKPWRCWMTWWVRIQGGVWTVRLLINNFCINKYTVVRPYPLEIAPHRYSHSRSIESWLTSRSIKLGS